MRFFDRPVAGKRNTKERLVKNYMTGLAVVLPMLLTACASSVDKQAETSLDPDPRVGKEVNQLCFARSVSSWRSVDNDRNAVILVMSNRDEYKLKISPGCDPDWAMSHIAIIKRGGSSCYARGDRIKTDADSLRGMGTACTIFTINKWNPDAANKNPDS
jgi:hypothetical protein